MNEPLVYPATCVIHRDHLDSVLLLPAADGLDRRTIVCPWVRQINTEFFRQASSGSGF